MSAATARRTRWFALAFCFLLSTQAGFAKGNEAVAERIQRIENGLLPAAVLAGDDIPTFTIQERMKLYNTPGLSLAVINDGRIEWARGYGVLELDGEDPVDTHTLFQAASISKPVVATLALRSVEMGLVDLDAPLNEVLKSWKIPENQYTRETPPTLRQLLAHRAGLTVHGFRGYTEGEPIPSVYQILDGAEPANSDPIVVDIPPGTQSRYSGGGYVLLQLLLAELHERSLRESMRRFVLEPAGMVDSAIAYPLDTELRINAASGHRRNGDLIDGKYRVHPEIGAGGLWTTASDLARWAIAIQRSLAGEEGALLERQTAVDMLTPQGGWGLGPVVAAGSEGDLIFSHDGSNAGYFCRLVAYAQRGQGVVAMLNGDDATIIAEIVRAVAREYGWPDFQVEVKKSVALTAEQLVRFAGRYSFGPMEIEIRIVDGGLVVRMPDGRAQPLHAESATTIFNLEDNIVIDFTFDEAGGFLSAAVTVDGKHHGDLKRL